MKNKQNLAPHLGSEYLGPRKTIQNLFLLYLLGFSNQVKAKKMNRRMKNKKIKKKGVTMEELQG